MSDSAFCGAQDTVFVAPANGVIEPIEKCSDTVFAQGMLGPGFIVHPSDGYVRCPVAGTVKLIHANNHGYAIETPHGEDVLVHLGIDTVSLENDTFRPNVHVGDYVEMGQALADAHWGVVKAAGRSDEIVVVVSEGAKEQFKLQRTGEAIAGEAVATYSA